MQSRCNSSAERIPRHNIESFIERKIPLDRSRTVSPRTARDCFGAFSCRVLASPQSFFAGELSATAKRSATLCERTYRKFSGVLDRYFKLAFCPRFFPPSKLRCSRDSHPRRKRGILQTFSGVFPRRAARGDPANSLKNFEIYIRDEIMAVRANTLPGIAGTGSSESI